MFTVSSTLIWAILTGPRDWVCHYAVHRGGCLELYYCNMVEWFWWYSNLILTTDWFPSVLWHCWFGHLACKNHPQNDLQCVEWDVKPLYYYCWVSLSVTPVSDHCVFKDETYAIHASTAAVLLNELLNWHIHTPSSDPALFSSWVWKLSQRCFTAAATWTSLASQIRPQCDDNYLHCCTTAAQCQIHYTPLCNFYTVATVEQFRSANSRQQIMACRLIVRPTVQPELDAEISASPTTLSTFSVNWKQVDVRSFCMQWQ